MSVESFARSLLSYSSQRKKEYRVSLEYLKECESLLDVGCGIGTFLEAAQGRAVGIDINPDNVEYCTSRGLKAVVGSALDLPYESASFDGVHCSHVLHVFEPRDAVQTIRELARVTKPGGIIVVTTHNWFPRFFRHPESARPYPPDALRRLFYKQKDEQSPMFPGMPNLVQEGIWFRRPPLIELWSARGRPYSQAAALFNAAQLLLRMVKIWTFDAYIVKFRKHS